MPDTICWCFDLSSLYLTIKEIIDENLNANAIENINEPKNPDIVLFNYICLYVKGNGDWTIEMDKDLLNKEFINDSIANVGKYKEDEGIRVLIRVVNKHIFWNYYVTIG